MGADLSDSQLYALQFTERFTSTLSLLGLIFIVYTYVFCKGFAKPINRLIFYAAWGNLGTVVAGLIANNGINAGQESGLCQFQAFIIQMFQGADVYWALCMSLNVYLALFHGWTTSRMRSLEWKYLTACYGLSAVPAIVYLFLTLDTKGRVYGPATIWCWITPSWSFLRVATLYGVVWLALAGALVIYSIALAKAWHHRRALIGLLNPLNEDPFGGIITTDIEVVISMANARRSVVAGDNLRLGSVFSGPPSYATKDGGSPYAVNVQGTDTPGLRDERSRPEVLRLPSVTRKAALAEENCEAWLYARVAFLYFLVMMICWIPASINRLVSLIDPHEVIFGLNYVAIVFLPLQGFLNALVYCVSSQTGIRYLLHFNLRGHAKHRDSERLRDTDANEEGFIIEDTNPYPERTPTLKPMESHRPSTLSPNGPEWDQPRPPLNKDPSRGGSSVKFDFHAR